MHRYLTLAAAALLAGGCAIAQEGRFERTLSVNGPLNLDVETDAGGIVVNAGPAGSIQIRGILKPSQSGWLSGAAFGDVGERIRRIESHPPIVQNGGTVRVGHLSRSETRGIQMRIEITAPPQTRLLARADSGGIRVDGIQGPADLKTDSGGVRARNIGADVRAATDSGGIHVEGVRGSVHARADSGGIEAYNVAGAIDAETDSGGLHLGQTKADTIRARTDSGGAEIKLARASGYDVRAVSDSGHVSVSELTVRGTLSRHRAEGRVRGGGPLVDVQVGSGHVSVE